MVRVLALRCMVGYFTRIRVLAGRRGSGGQGASIVGSQIASQKCFIVDTRKSRHANLCVCVCVNK